MFKFQFDIDEADDAQEILNIGIESIKLDESSESMATETTSSELEPFSEISLKKLVRDNTLLSLRQRASF